MMMAAHHRGQPSTSSVRSFDEQNEHATDYISGMYQDFSSDPIPPSLSNQGPVSKIRKKELPSSPWGQARQETISTTSSSGSSWSKSSIQSTPAGSTVQRSGSSDSIPTTPERKGPALELKSPALTRPRIRPPSPPALSTQLPLSGLNGNDGSSPSSPAEIAKELSNLQAFKRMSLDVSNQVSDPDLPSTLRSVPDFAELMEAGVDQDAARLLWVPAHLHPEISANDDWKDFVQRRVEETKTTGTISRVKSIGGGTQKRLSRSKSILSRQIDPSDEESWSTYSDAGRKELEKRSSLNKGGERHMITVTELEKLEALIKEGALERQGRPPSGERQVEIAQTAASDDFPPEDVQPLVPIKGTLKRSAHTSMRNLRGRGLAAARSARRVSEPKKETSRVSSASLSEEDGITRLVESPDSSFVTSPVSLLRGRSDPAPRLDRNASIETQEARATPDLDRSKTNVPTILEQPDQTSPPKSFQLIPETLQTPQSIIQNEEAVLGQVQPRQLRRPQLRRQTVEAPEPALTPLLSPTSPTKDRTPDRSQKKSPVSPKFPPDSTPTSDDKPAQLQVTPSSPSYTTYQPPLPPTPEPSIQPTQSKKGAWSRLFTYSSDDEQPREKTSSRKPKKSPTEGSKAVDLRLESQNGAEVDRKSVAESAFAIPTPPTSPPPSISSKQSNKKESGLFASLFGSKKKSESKEKQSKSQETTATSTKSNAQDRLQYQRHGPGGWADQGNIGPPILGYYYTRFPIHVERAIYRLSHIKLANPRRPLLQQVLLSNFMYGYLNLINKAAQPASPAPEVVQQPPPQDAYVEPSQSEEHVFYSSDDQNDYYGQDYYGAEYDDGQDDSVPQGHDVNQYDYAGYQSAVPITASSAQGSSQSSSYSKSAQQSYDQTHLPNGQRPDASHESDDDHSSGNAFILRDSRGRTLSFPKSGASVSSGNSWAGGNDEPSHSSGKRYH